MSAENSENFRSNRFFGAHKRDLGALKDNNSRHFFRQYKKINGGMTYVKKR